MILVAVCIVIAILMIGISDYSARYPEAKKICDAFGYDRVEISGIFGTFYCVKRVPVDDLLTPELYCISEDICAAKVEVPTT